MKLNATLAVSAAALLAACGGGSSGTSATNTLLSSEYGTASSAFAAGNILVAREGNVTSISAINGSGDGNQIRQNAKISVRSGDDAELILSIDDTDYPFTVEDQYVEDDGRIFGYVVDDDDNKIYVHIFQDNGQIPSFIEGRDNWFVKLYNYQLIREIDSENEVWTNERGYFVVGTETSNSAMGRFSSQTSFNGWSQGDSVGGDVDRIWRNRNQILSDVSIDVDFSQNTLTGELNNIRVRPRVDNVWGERVAVDGKVLFLDGIIENNTFSGTTRTDETLQTALSITEASGTFQGSFFGSDAQQLGGSYSLSNEDFNAAGAFLGRYQTNQ